MGVRAAAQTKGFDSPYSRIAVGFEAEHMSFELNEDSRNFPGLSLSYTRGYAFCKKIPVGMEFGAKVAWNHKEEDGQNVSTKTDFLKLSIPVDFMYRFGLFGQKIGVAPFSGPNFKFNIVGRRQLLNSDDSKCYKTINLLSSDAYCPASIFQFGWRLGLNLYYWRFFLGYAFIYDLNHYVDEARGDYGVDLAGEVKTSSHTVAVGYTF